MRRTERCKAYWRDESVETPKGMAWLALVVWGWMLLMFIIWWNT